MTEDSYYHLQAFLVANRKKPSQQQVETTWCFTCEGGSIRSNGRVFINVDGFKGPHLILLDYPENFENDFHSSFNCAFAQMNFDALLNQLTIVDRSDKVREYTMVIQG